jgi:DNA-binding MarR family transcriptional regulator
VGRVRARDEVLGYLLKHAHLALEHRAQDALAAVGVTVRDLGVLRVIASGEAQSQQEAAAVLVDAQHGRGFLLGVDRTSMVALLDALERRGIVARRPSEQDRRRNIIALTDHGWEVYQQAESRYSEIERDFTAPLGDAGAAGLRQALRTVLSENGHA